MINISVSELVIPLQNTCQKKCRDQIYIFSEVLRRIHRIKTRIWYYVMYISCISISWTAVATKTVGENSFVVICAISKENSQNSSQLFLHVGHLYWTKLSNKFYTFVEVAVLQRHWHHTFGWSISFLYNSLQYRTACIWSWQRRV